MFQVRIHGRGGQGVVTAAEMLSVAAFLEGKHAQAFPSFGSERTGAPVVAFCRIADAEIRLARFAALFEGQTKARHFTLEPSNFATFAKDGDGARLEAWLVRQGFAMSQNTEVGPDGVWRLES